MANLRLVDLIAPLSQVTDLGMGQPPETAIRTCLVATRLAREMGIPESIVGDIYRTALLQHLGCTAYAHETAALIGGDDIALRANGATVDTSRPREALPFLLLGIGRGTPPLVRLRAIVAMLRAGSAFDEALSRANCEVATRIADRLGLDPGVQVGLNHIYERWDGKGQPGRLRHEEIALPARFAQVAGQAVLFDLLGGAELAVETVRRRAGRVLDPAIAAAFARHGAAILAGIAATDASVAVLAEEPEPRGLVAEGNVDDIARAFGEMVDLTSPYLHGHASGVARLAEAAAGAMDLSETDRVAIRRAGHLHDIGRAGVPSGIWDKPGPLTTVEWEQVRLHAYHGERIVAQSRPLAHLAPLVGMHHERLDGSGYHRQATGAAIPTGARVLAAADVYQAMTRDRPHRPAHRPDAAAAQLVADARAGKLDGAVVEAILASAGHARTPREHPWPAGLTDREVEVLRLAARGLSNRRIGERLFISPKTADHHVQHIYAKIGVSTRAGAAIYAMQHDLLDPGGELG
jgi:HD-GYP domain-containing protein (c-di-GMP phosphodiesterase class II)